MLSDFVIPSNAAKSEILANCDHSLGTYTVQTDDGMYTGNRSAEGHDIKYLDDVFCVACNAFRYKKPRTETENHIFSITTDLGHIGTTNQHRLRSDCGECGYPGEIHIVPCLYIDCAG